MGHRARAAKNAIASVRLEGLEPGLDVEAFLAQWARGDATMDDLREARRRVVAGEPLDDLMRSESVDGSVRPEVAGRREG